MTREPVRKFIVSPADAPKSIAVPAVPTMMPALVRLQGPAPPAVTPVAPEMIPELTTVAEEKAVMPTTPPEMLPELTMVTPSPAGTANDASKGSGDAPGIGDVGAVEDLDAG